MTENGHETQFSRQEKQVKSTDKLLKTSTCLHRSCAALASFSGAFDFILFQAVNFEFIVKKIWFGLVWIDSLNKKIK